MNLWGGLGAVALLVSGFASPVQSTKPKLADEMTLIISGNAAGHLAPCGCTKPMSGGLKRLASLVRQLKSRGKTVWLDLGSASGEGGRQEQLKVETYYEALGNLKVDVVAFSGPEAFRGMSTLGPGKALSKATWIGDATGLPSGSVMPSAKVGVFQFTYRPESRVISIRTPKSLLTAFYSDGTASVGGMRVTPGSHLRGIVVARFSGGKLVSVQAVPLESRIADDPMARKVYDNYQRRIAQFGLIHQVPRTNEIAYVGSGKCASCHQEATRVHNASKHAVAYETLQNDRHDKDPECVTCHVVGLDSTNGFVDGKTPHLAEVGCESCHGGGTAHIESPYANKMGKAGLERCTSCHTPKTSPNFNSQIAWAKIRH
jgi:hypothetical protein